MPYCPKCRYEYRDEIKRCPDCDVNLVEELTEDELVCVGAFFTEGDAQIARLKLDSLGIWSTMKNETISQVHPVLAFSDGGIKICVAKADEEAALKALQD